MVFGGVEQDRIQFNEETLWTGGPRNYNKKNAFLYLEQIRKLLQDGKQKEAELLAEKEFMGTKSNEDKKAGWIASVTRNQTYAAEKYADMHWPEMTMPVFEGWEKNGLENVDGAIWFRKTFEVKDSMLQKKLLLQLNRISNADYTFINGILIGTMESAEPRKYTVPQHILHPGVNTIAVLVLNFSDKGGLLGFKDTSKHIGFYAAQEETALINLQGKWKYNMVQDDPPALGTYQASYQPFGDLFLNFSYDHEIQNYKRSLNISNAIATTTYRVKDIAYTRTYLVSQPDQVLAIKISASENASVQFKVQLSSPHKKFTIKKIDANTIALEVRLKNGVLFGESYRREGFGGK
jgi:alpha-L-fucosidase 2